MRAQNGTNDPVAQSKHNAVTQAPFGLVASITARFSIFANTAVWSAPSAGTTALDFFLRTSAMGPFRFPTLKSLLCPAMIIISALMLAYLADVQWKYL